MRGSVTITVGTWSVAWKRPETREERLERFMRAAISEAHLGTFPGDPGRQRCIGIVETLESGLNHDD